MKVSDRQTAGPFALLDMAREVGVGGGGWWELSQVEI